MGWKYTTTVDRNLALGLLLGHFKADCRHMNNEDLGNYMDEHFGDDVDLPYHGCNFHISGSEPDEKELIKLQKYKDILNVLEMNVSNDVKLEKIREIVEE